MQNRVRIFLSLTTLLFVVLGGTLFYHFQEGWSWTDSFYFSGVTVTTVGYGDFSPLTEFGKIFTVFYAMLGVGIAIFSLTTIAQNYFETREEQILSKFSKEEEERFSRFERYEDKKIEEKLKLYEEDIKKKRQKNKRDIINSFK